MSKSITVKQLQDVGACSAQVDKFVELFGSKVNVTKKLALQYYNVFDWNWVCSALLSKSASAEYDKVCNPARAEYNKVRATTFVKCYLKG